MVHQALGLPKPGECRLGSCPDVAGLLMALITALVVSMTLTMLMA